MRVSVGLLGLGQLQAALWKSAGHLYAVSEAYLVSASYLERGLSAGANPGAIQQRQSAQLSSAYTVFDLTVEAERKGWVTELDIFSHWEDSAGANTVYLQTAVYHPNASDSRWLSRPE
jgi:hypothetical protein